MPIRIALTLFLAAYAYASSLSSVDARTWIADASTDPPPECSSAMTGTSAAHASFLCVYAPIINGFQSDSIQFSGIASAATGIGPYGLGVAVEAIAYGVGEGIGTALANANQTVSFTTPYPLLLTFFSPPSLYGLASVQVDGATPIESLFREASVTLDPDASHTLTFVGRAGPTNALDLSQGSLYLENAVFLDASGNPQGPAIWTGDTFITESQTTTGGTSGHPETTPITTPEPAPAALIAPALLLLISRFCRQTRARRSC